MLESHSLDEFSQCVESIYASALQPSLWPRAVAQIASLHHSDKALLFTPVVSPADGGFAFPHGISETAMLDWGGRYIQHDLWTRAGMQRALVAGEAVIDTDLVADEVLLESTFYREFLVHHQIRRLCTGMVFDGQGGDVPMTGCSVYGPPTGAPFDQRNRHLHALTLRHLSRSLGTMIRLRDAELRLASTLAALDRLDGGILLLGTRGQVMYANPAARHILAAEDGLSLRASTLAGDAEGWLHARSTVEQTALRQEIDAVLAADPLHVRHFCQGLSFVRPSGRRNLVLQLAPLTEHSALAHADRHVGAIAFLSDPDQRKILDPTVMAKLYGATAAEVRLAQELLVGDTLPEIATRLALSENTLKTQLKSLFAKTATHRQADLVKLLISLARPASANS